MLPVSASSLCFLIIQLILIHGQTDVSDGSTRQDQHDTEVTAIIVTAVMCGLGLIICCSGIILCCYIKCCTGEGCII